MGLPEVNIRTFVRTGDTPQSERTAMTKRPPHIIVTTPESLYILLTSEGGRREKFINAAGRFRRVLSASGESGIVSTPRPLSRSRIPTSVESPAAIELPPPIVAKLDREPG